MLHHFYLMGGSIEFDQAINCIQDSDGKMLGLRLKAEKAEELPA
jgi:hypothetical protein